MATKKNGNGNGRILKVEDNIERMLKCDLSEEQLQEHAERLANLQAEIDTKTDEKKAEAARAKGVIDQLSAERQLLAQEYRQRWGMRSVRCYAQRDYEKREYQVVREDLDKIVDRRKLRDDEIQGHIGEHGA